MPVITERDLTYLVLSPAASDLKAGSVIKSFSLVSGPQTHFSDFEWKIDFPFPHAYRILVTGPNRPRPPHDNLKAPADSCSFRLASLDTEGCSAVFDFPQATEASKCLSGLADERLQLKLRWKYQVYSEVVRVGTHQTDKTGRQQWLDDDEDDDENSEDTPDEDSNDDHGETVARPQHSSSLIIRDLEARPWALTEHGMIHHWSLDRTRLHLGLGEKAAPIDLTGRSFVLHAADSAWYDAYRTDPLYKHTPFLISTPRPTENFEQEITYAIAHGTNSTATWDVGLEIDYPSGGWSKRFIQDWGGLEEWTMFGRGVEGVVKTFAELAGKPMLVGRDWLGYLGSTMLLSDKENAQELLEEWPKLCVKHDIPCSAMHLSSGFTVDEESKNRWTFHLNKKRYPDFKGMMKIYHEAGIKMIPNVKPYLLRTHPASDRLIEANGLYYDPISRGPSKQNLWSSGEGESGAGSWADFTAAETREWWAEGVKKFVDLGVDGMWDDNSEFYTRDDELLFKNDMPEGKREVTIEGPVKTGLMGRLLSNELMNKVSHDTLVKAAPTRRPFILTRSGNVAAFSTGADVGGFCGDAPGPELFARWVQLGVTHSRFCIHSGPHDTRGREKLSTPWMYPEMLPVIREHIKWRYVMLPFINNLMWRSHQSAAPANAPLFYGSFATDPNLYHPEHLEDFNAWMGVGQLLVAPQLFEKGVSKEVYFPKSAKDDKALYFNLHAPFERLTAGETTTVSTPIEHGGLFAREGAVIPIGKPKATVTALSGDPRTHTDGVDVILEDEGGQVGVDDWRGVLLFPGSKGSTYCDDWIEDDGISADPGTYKVKLTYTGKRETVEVNAVAEDHGFAPLWKGKLHVVLPVGDLRTVMGAERVSWDGRDAWAIDVN